MVLFDESAGIVNDHADVPMASTAAVIGSLPLAVMIVSPDGTLQLANAPAVRLFELDRRAVGFKFPGGCDISFYGTQGNTLDVADLPGSRVASGRQSVSKAVVSFDRLDGTQVWLECTAARVEPDGPESPITLSFHDITDLHTLQKRFFAGAEIDQLTGLPRLPSVLVRVNELLQSGSGEDADRSDVVMVINFDKLRELNESLGHLRGDEALARAAERLRECLPQPHLLGRVVGAEFCAVLQGADQDFIDDVSDAIHLALTEPIVIYDVEVRLRASIGLVRIKPDDERSAEEIVSAADTAMYYARNKGGGHTIDFNTLRINDE